MRERGSEHAQEKPAPESREFGAHGHDAAESSGARRAARADRDRFQNMLPVLSAAVLCAAFGNALAVRPYGFSAAQPIGFDKLTPSIDVIPTINTVRAD